MRKVFLKVSHPDIDIICTVRFPNRWIKIKYSVSVIDTHLRPSSKVIGDAGESNCGDSSRADTYLVNIRWRIIVLEGFLTDDYIQEQFQ